jgi:purine-cytosine permease-like protein
VKVRLTIKRLCSVVNKRLATLYSASGSTHVALTHAINSMFNNAAKYYVFLSDYLLYQPSSYNSKKVSLFVSRSRLSIRLDDFENLAFS